MTANEIGGGDRYASGGVAGDGSLRFPWNLTTRNLSDHVNLSFPPVNVLPVVFVPGIMGSNLCKLSDPKIPVWRLDNSKYFNWIPKAKDKPVGLAWDMKNMKPGQRQKLMHPRPRDGRLHRARALQAGRLHHPGR